MPITIQWFNNDHTIVLYEIKNPWTWDEFDAAFYQSFNMAENSEQIVDAILDVSAGRKLPAGSLTQGSKIIKELRKQDNTGIAVCVGAPEFLKMIVQVFNRIYQQNVVQVFFAESRIDAVQIITDYRGEL